MSTNKWKYNIKLELSIYRYKDEELLSPIQVGKSTIATIGNDYPTEKKAEIAKTKFLTAWLFCKYNLIN